MEDKLLPSSLSEVNHVVVINNISSYIKNMYLTKRENVGGRWGNKNSPLGRLGHLLTHPKRSGEQDP